MAERNDVAAIVCMDEHADVEEVALGLGGSFVVAPEREGNLNVFPREMRLLIKANQGFIFPALLLVASRMGMTLVGTDHLGCGWDGAQGITDQDANTYTTQTLSEHGIYNVGTITRSNEFVSMDGILSARMRRWDHHHVARATVLTVNGGAKHQELMDVTQNQDAFLISADWAKPAAEMGMDSSAIVQILAFEIQLANALTRGGATEQVQIYDAGRVDRRFAQHNSKVANLALQSVQ